MFDEQSEFINVKILVEMLIYLTFKKLNQENREIASFLFIETT